VSAATRFLTLIVSSPREEELILPRVAFGH